MEKTSDPAITPAPFGAEGRLMSRNGRRLIEDFLPIQQVSKEASREKSVRKGHISSLHLWWARRPLVACRAAVFGSLVPADFWLEVEHPGPAAEGNDVHLSHRSVRRMNRAAAGRFLEELCKYPGSAKSFVQARQYIFEAHAAKLTRDLGRPVSAEDIRSNKDLRPRLLDMFAGGGSIPLETARLGCAAHALDINPVAYVINLCTLYYPQAFGPADPQAAGGGPSKKWAGLAEEVSQWGRWVLEKARGELEHFYPPVPDPAGQATAGQPQQQSFARDRRGLAEGHLLPVAYLWTRTARCKNVSCGATVPLVRQTWLCQKKGRCVALRMETAPGSQRVRFEVVESTTPGKLGFDPAGFSKKGCASCPFCGTVADSGHVKQEGVAGRLGWQAMAIVCARRDSKGKVYLSADDHTGYLPDDSAVLVRIEQLCRETGLTTPDEPLPPTGALGFRVQPYGIRQWKQLFSPRQLLCLLTFTATVRKAELAMRQAGYTEGHVRAIVTYLAAMVDKLADFNSVQCTWNYTGGRGVKNSFTRQILAMTWDFAETNPFNPAGASWTAILDDIPAGIRMLCDVGQTLPEVIRGSATSLPWPDGTFDAIVTDPPYYDNVPYANLSDFFYVWLKRCVGHIYPEHFANEVTPKKLEIVADPVRYGGSMGKATAAYEGLLRQALAEGGRVLKPYGQATVVYAHKTTLGWSTLVEALRQAGFVVTEAWPMTTERKGRMRAINSAALTSSIFLVARKRNGAGAGAYEEQVRPELEQIVRERVETLWKMGITGADLIIAAVGAGLRAFTQYASVQFANGEDMPAAQFLREVEAVVHEGLLEKIFRAGRSKVARVDSPSRFYVLWRYTYGTAELAAGEAIVFTYGLDVELDNGLSTGSKALIQKKKATYRLRDYSERGDSPQLGLPAEDRRAAPLIDVLHRVLWLMDNDPRALPKYLAEAGPDRERLRVVAQTLAGPGLKGAEEAEAPPTVTTTPKEQSALGKLLANWKSLIETPLGDGPLFDRVPPP